MIMDIPRPKDFVWLTVPFVYEHQVYYYLKLIQMDALILDGLEWIIISGEEEYYAVDCMFEESIKIEETLGTKEDCEFLL